MKDNNRASRGYSALRAELKREREKVRKLGERLNELDDEEVLWDLVKDNTGIKNRIIAEYLRSFSERKSVPFAGSNGVIALTPVHRPKNLADAKRLADKIIKF